jgi:hypothetical protein
VDTSTWFLEPKPNESPTEYNVDMLTLASRKQVAVSEIQLVDSPAKNTHKASRKRYDEEVDHDENSEEEYKPPLEEDNTSNGTVEDTDEEPTTTMTTTKAQLKIQCVARAGGTLDMAETGDEMEYEIKMLKKESNFNEGTTTFDGDGEEAADEEDGDGDAVEVSIPVDPAEEQEIHKETSTTSTHLTTKKTTNAHLIHECKIQ